MAWLVADVEAHALVEAIGSALGADGLILRGGFSFRAGEDAPFGPGGRSTKSILLVGQAGASIWPHFSRWRESQEENLTNPLDAWSREVIGEVAVRFNARAVFPFEKPFLPFQQWAIRAEGLKPSPLGILMHPEYGLWHAYRGALLFEEELRGLRKSDRAVQEPIHLCDLCVGKPCLSACPVDAYSERGFAYDACLGHLKSGRGETCMTSGCLARNVCPYGQTYRYPAEVQAFHQGYFVGA